LLELNGEIYNSIIVTAELSSPHSITDERTSQNINMEIEDWNDVKKTNSSKKHL
jgi:hypothetical protein